MGIRLERSLDPIMNATIASDPTTVPESTCTRPRTGALLGIHALTPLHAGAGTALGTVDLPIQRERHNGWPNLASSGLKGVLRDACRESRTGYSDDPPDTEHGRSRRKKADFDETLVWLFGPPTVNALDGAGALIVTDARLLAFPVRSLRGVFAWVTCPAALDRFQRDAALAGVPLKLAVPAVAKEHAVVAANCPCLIDTTRRLILEEFDFAAVVAGLDTQPATIAKLLVPDTDAFTSTRSAFEKKLVVLHDDDFTHFVRHATEVNARIGLDYETKTVRDGALFYQEFLPTETLLYALVLVNEGRRKAGPNGSSDPLTSLAGFLPPFIQIGGDETTGKGLCATRLSGLDAPTVDGTKEGGSHAG